MRTLLPDTKAEGKGFREAFRDYYANAKSFPALGYISDTHRGCQRDGGAVQRGLRSTRWRWMPVRLIPRPSCPPSWPLCESAGMQKYVDAANAQMDAYMAK